MKKKKNPRKYFFFFDEIINVRFLEMYFSFFKKTIKNLKTPEINRNFDLNQIIAETIRPLYAYFKF